MFVSFSHNTLYISTQKEVLLSYFDLFNVLNLDDMANIGRGQSINLLNLFHCIVVFIIDKVGSTEFRQKRIRAYLLLPIPFGGTPQNRPYER